MSTAARRPFHEASRSFRGGAVSRTGALLMSFVLVAALAWTGAAGAQLPLNAAGAQFNVTGFIQAATLDAPGDVLAGGTVLVNGHTIIVPRNTIFQMPAFALTWQQMFAMSPPPYTGTQTGLALTDVPTPLGTYEISVAGNIINNTYIAGLIYMSQSSLNGGDGFINYMDYANGEMRVGGVIGDPSTGARVKINDPSGRFAPVYTGDPRFTIDNENPTIATETGFPLCFPHVNPATADDPLCPQRNRPIAGGFYQSIFTMQDPATGPQMALPDHGPATGTNSYIAAPFEVGDHVSFAGTLMKDGPKPSAGPWPVAGAAATYIAAHTIAGNVGIFTAPGTLPVYVGLEFNLLGVGGLPIPGLAQEATTRTGFGGFVTDPSRNVSLWGIDVDACSDTTSDRDWGTVSVDPGAPTGAVKGRWRTRPTKQVLTGPAAGTYLPATRMMRAVSIGAYSAANPVISNNGLITGQYEAPIGEYLFPENLGIGSPPVPLNLIDFPFLVNGTFAAFPGLNVGQLVPFPSAFVPAPLCGPTLPPAPPTAVATFAPAAPAVNSLVTLDGSASTDPNGLAIAWVWTPPAGITLNSTTVPQPTFTPTAAGVYTFSLTVTNTSGLSSAPVPVSVTVSAATSALPPVANAGAAQTAGSNRVVQLDGSASSDPNVPAQALTYAWTQTGFGQCTASACPPVTLSNPAAAAPTFTTPLNTRGKSTVLTFSLKVTNTSLLTSAASLVNITLNPVVAPIANAGTSQSVLINRTVRLDGSLSLDPSGLPITYLWTPGGGVTLSSRTAAKPTFTAPANTTRFDVNLTVNNGFITSTTSRVTINVVSVPDTVAITAVTYRISKQRLDITATSSIATATPTLAPVLSLVGFGTNGTDLPMAFAGGTYTTIVQGVAEPLSVTITSSAGGSASSPVTVRLN